MIMLLSHQQVFSVSLNHTAFSVCFICGNFVKRIPLNVQKEKYDQIKAATDTAGEKVNSYIKKAVDQRMERDTHN